MDNLEVLHDHYKDTFCQIRDRERQRDKYFYLVVGLYALLVFEIQYAASFGGALEPVRAPQGSLDLSALPLPGLLSVSWVLTLAVALKYCQLVISVERQYSYLHEVEAKMSEGMGGNLFHREGRNYLEGMPLFQLWVWTWYVLLVPVLAILATVLLYYIEATRLPYPLQNKLVDAFPVAGILLSFYLYRLHPLRKRVKSVVREFK